MTGDDEPQRPTNSSTRALRLALAAHERKVDERGRKVDERVERIEATVTEVAAAVSKLTREATTPPPSWHWDDLDDGDRLERWALLEAWVEKVLRPWHPRTAVALRPCWAKHPPAVAAVTAAWIAWEGAYRGAQRRNTDPAAWLRDWLPALATQLHVELGEPSRDVLGEVDLTDNSPCTEHTEENLA